MKQYVVVTIAPNGIVHTYGNDDGKPFFTRYQCQQLIKKLRKMDEAMYPGGEPVEFKTCLVIGSKLQNAEK